MATTTQQSIQGFYQNILRRIGPAADVTYWTGVVDVQGVPLSQVENTFVTSPEAMTFVSPIVEIYQTYLGRAPDSAGFNAWVNALHSGMSLSAVENDFANSAESQAYYGGSISTPADSAFVTKLYQTVLNRAPTPAEVTAILAVTTNRATLLQDFLQSPEAGVTLTNASNQFLTAIGSGNTDPYGVSLFSGGSTVSNVFTLTPGADTIPGVLVGSNGTTSNNGNITINGLVDSTTPANTTLNAADQLAGGNGANTMNVTYAGPAFVPDATNGALISEVQTFNARNTDPAAFVILDATNVPGLTAFNSNLGTGDVEVDNLAAGASAGIIGNGTVASGDLTADYVPTATAAIINLSGGTGTAVPAGPPVTVDGAGVTSTTVNSTGGANTIAELELSGTATKTLTVVAATNLKATGVDSPALTSITASGAATSVNLGDLSLGPDPVTTIDASGLTAGGISVKNVGPALTKFTGGVGNDSLLLAGGVIQASPALDGGTGTNILGIGDTGDLSLTPAIYAGINAAMNFETLELTGNGVTVDSSLLNPASSTLPTSPYTKIALNWAGANPDTINNLDATRSLSIINAANGGVLVNAALGSPALTLSLDGGKTAAAAVGGIGLDIAGSTAVGLTSNGTAATAPDNSINFLTTEFNATVTVSGKQNLDIGGLQLGPGGAGADKGVLNASAFTGKLDVVADAGGGNTQTISVGSGGSVIGLTAADVSAILNLGAGTDQIQFLAPNASGLFGPPTTDIATANSFTAGAGGDDLDNLSGGGSNTYTALTAAQQTAITGAADLTTAMNLAAVDVPGGWTAFTFGGDTFAQNTVGGGAYSATDNVIDLKSTSVAALTQSNFG